MPGLPLTLLLYRLFMQCVICLNARVTFDIVVISIVYAVCEFTNDVLTYFSGRHLDTRHVAPKTLLR